MSANFNISSDADLVESPAPAPVAPTASQAGPLAYDFDIVTVAPDAAQQAHLDALASLGQETDEIKVEARWRDPAMIAAMAKASPGVRDLFGAAGFGTLPSNTRLPPGSYAAEDAEARHAIVMRLTNSLAEANAIAFEWGQIDVTAFFKAHAEASSVRTSPAQSTAKAPAFNKQKFAVIGLAVGIALLVIAGISAL